MEEAKNLFFKRKIYGVVYIPSDYEEKLLGGLQANVAIYADATVNRLFTKEAAPSSSVL